MLDAQLCPLDDDEGETGKLGGTPSPGCFSRRRGCLIKSAVAKSVAESVADIVDVSGLGENQTTSSEMGAPPATSKVSICQGAVESWDQGWNEADEQVWGAVKAGYVFLAKDLPEGW